MLTHITEIDVEVLLNARDLIEDISTYCSSILLKIDSESEEYQNQRCTQTGVDSGRSFDVSAGVISFQLLQEQDPE